MNQLRIPLQRPAPALDVTSHDGLTSGATSGATESGWGRVLAVSLSRAALVMVAGLLVWSVLPLAVGWTPRAIMSGSMEPRVHAGDVVVGRPVDPAQLVKDQVVTVTDPDHPVKTRTHRLLRRDAQGRLVLKGDANPQADSTPVEPEAVLGLGVIRVPYVARPVYWWAERAYVPLGTTLALLLLVGLTAAAPLRLGPPRRNGPPGDPGAGAAPPEGRQVEGAVDEDLVDAGLVDAGLVDAGLVDAGLGGLTPSGRRRTASSSTSGRRRGRALFSVVAAVLVSSTLGLAAPAHAAYVRTVVNGPNSWTAAANFRPYRTAVLADSPFLFWRLNETSGTIVDDETAANRDGTLPASGYAWGQPGALASEASERSLALTGAVITGNTQVAGPARFSVEAWVRTTSTNGGRVLGFGDGAGQNASGTVDRQLYAGTNGRVYFGVGSAKTVVASTAAVNDGRWHHVVGTFTTGNGGMRLYVDGVLQGTGVGTLQSFNGYWRAGAETMSGWTANPGQFFVGNLEELAVYTSSLTAAQVKAHYDAAVTP